MKTFTYLADDCHHDCCSFGYVGSYAIKPGGIGNVENTIAIALCCVMVICGLEDWLKMKISANTSMASFTANVHFALYKRGLTTAMIAEQFGLSVNQLDSSSRKRQK